MAKLNALRGSTSRIAWMFLPDSASTTGAGKTGLTNASAALNVTLRREKVGAVTTYTGANIGAVATLGTWADPGAGKVNFKEVDATNLPGIYELHFRDAVFDASDTSRWVAGMVTATGIGPAPFEIALDAVDAQDAVRGGLSALPAVAAGANGGLPTIDSNLEVKASTLRTNNDKTGYTLSAAGVQAVWDALTSALTTAGSIGKRLADDIDATISSRSTYAGADTAGTTTLLGRIAAALTITGGKVDVNDKTGFALTSAEETAIADALLKRDMAAVAGEAARSPLNALRFLRNLWDIAGGTLIVKKEDDTTTAWTAAVTQTAGNPVSRIDPT